MSEEIKQKERFEDNWKTFCDIVNSVGDTQAKKYLNSFIQSEIELALQKRDEGIIELLKSKKGYFRDMRTTNRNELCDELITTLTTK